MAARSLAAWLTSGLIAAPGPGVAWRRVAGLSQMRYGLVVGRGLAVAALLFVGCAFGNDRRGDDDAAIPPRDAGVVTDAGARDAATDGGPRDAGAPDAGPRDAGPRDAGLPDGGPRDAGPDDAGPVDAGAPDAGGALDPDLAVPPSGTSCDYPGSMSECGFVEVCRFYDASEGRCETCDACGNLFDPCVASRDCDILFMCFRGMCTNFCTLGTYECGPIEDCIDIGHPSRGVCRPGW